MKKVKFSLSLFLIHRVSAVKKFKKVFYITEYELCSDHVKILTRVFIMVSRIKGLLSILYM